MRVKKYNSIALLSTLSLAVAACGSDGGKTVQLESTSMQRAQSGKAQIAAAEAAARAADKRVNPTSPNVSIRTGSARTSSMDGTNWSANQVTTAPSTSAPQTSSASSNDKSMLLMAGIAAFALFGKEIIKGGAAAVGEAGSALKSVITPQDKGAKSQTTDQTNQSVNEPQVAGGNVPAKSGAIQLPGAPSGPQVGVTPGPAGNAPAVGEDRTSNNQAAALPSKNVDTQPQQVAVAPQAAICVPKQGSALAEIKKFWNDATKSTTSEVQL